MSYLRHGYFGTKIHKRVGSIIRRCTQPNASDYPRYGGRGITVYSEWISNIGEFCKYLENLYPNTEELLQKGYQIDRIDNEKGYEPGNLRIVTPKENANNRSDCIILHLSEGDMTVAQACEKYGFSHNTVLNRYHKGLRGDSCISKSRVYSKVSSKYNQIPYNGEYYSLMSLCRVLGLDYKKFSYIFTKNNKDIRKSLEGMGIAYKM